MTNVIIYSPSISSKPVWMYLFCWTQRKIFWRMWETEQFWGTIDFHSIYFLTMEVNPELLCLPHSSEYLPLCSAEKRHPYRFGTTWGWVSDDRIFIFGWTIPLINRDSSHNVYIIYVTLDHKTSLKSLGCICSNSQQYIVWVKCIFFYAKNHLDIK